jgi:predicted PurR-regulated permease PerM
MAELVPLRPVAQSDRDTSDANAELASFGRRVLVVVAIVGAAALAAAGVWAGRTALLLIYVSLLIAIGLLPMIQRIERATKRPGRSLPRWVVIGVVYATFLGVVLTTAALVIPAMLVQAEELARRMPSLIASWQSGLVAHGLLSRPLTVAEAITQTAPSATPNAVAPPIAIAATAVRGLAGVVIESFTVMILTFYILIDGVRAATEMARAVPARHRARVLSVGRDVTGRVSAWLQGNLIVGGIMGSATALIMGVLGEPYFWVVALVAAAGEMVPIAGPLLAGLFAFVLALTVSVKLALTVGLIFLVLHEIEANVLVPRIMSRQVGLSPLAVVVALLLAADWFGLPGAILAIPTTAIASAIILELRSPTEKLAPAQNRKSP